MDEALRRLIDEPRHTRRAFWIVKTVALFSISILIVVLFVLYGNFRHEQGRKEILDRPVIQYLVSGNPVCIWGETVYPAIAFDAKRNRITIKKVGR